ncbi:MAG: sel1 repeat family protein [Myxococcus sp.]|nr:sel1 repeat family protein [Myxococcus sp.]
MRVMLLLPLVAFGALAQPAAPAPPTITLEDLARACAKGDLVSCTDYGFNLEAPDPEKAVTVYRAACAKDALPACSNLALMLRDARGAPKNLVEAAKVAKKACDGGNAPGCLHLALVKDAANDFEAASAAYEHACTLKVLPACTNYAINVLKGVGVKKDEKRALTLLEKSCGDSVKKGAAFPSLRACVVLGQLYDQGALVPKNQEAARRLYKLACFGGLEEGCARLGAGPKNANDDGHNH